MLEIERLGEPIGKQDQYAAAYGGINLIEFERHGGVTVQPLLLPHVRVLSELEGNLMLFYTGMQRDARDVLSNQVAAIEANSQAFPECKKWLISLTRCATFYLPAISTRSDVLYIEDGR